jgi:hypothetical protein
LKAHGVDVILGRSRGGINAGRIQGWKEYEFDEAAKAALNEIFTNTLALQANRISREQLLKE